MMPLAHIFQHPPQEIADIGIWNGLASLFGSIMYLLFSMVGRHADPKVDYATRDYLRQKFLGIVWGVLAGQVGLLCIIYYWQPLTLIKSFGSGFMFGTVFIVLYPFIQIQVVDKIKRMMGVTVISEKPVELPTQPTVEVSPDHPVQIIAKDDL